MRMNKKLLDQIVRKIMADTVVKKCDERMDERNTIGKRILDRIVEFDGATEALKLLPGHYFESRTFICVHTSPDVTDGGIVLRKDFLGNSEYLQIYIGYEKAYALNHSTFHVLGENDSDVVAYLIAHKEAAHLGLNVTRDKIRNKLFSMLSPFKTTEKLIEALPDFEKYIPEGMKVSEAKLPMVLPEEITNYVNSIAA